MPKKTRRTKFNLGEFSVFLTYKMKTANPQTRRHFENPFFFQILGWKNANIGFQINDVASINPLL